MVSTQRIQLAQVTHLCQCPNVVNISSLKVSQTPKGKSVPNGHVLEHIESRTLLLEYYSRQDTISKSAKTKSISYFIHSIFRYAADN